MPSAFELARLDQAAVFARQSHRGAAGGVDGGDNVLVDGAREHHFDDLDGAAVGHPQTVDEVALDAQPAQHVADLRAAAVDDDGVDADLLHQHHVAREVLAQLGIAHGVAAILDDEGLAGEPAQVRQRLGKRLRGLQIALEDWFRRARHGLGL